MPRVEVIYARADHQSVVRLELAADTTAGSALRQSGLLDKFPEIDAAACQFGIFGKPVLPNQILCDGDRVEIYRSLKTDPKEARRERARRQR